MEQLFLYLLKSSGLLIVFFLAYHFLLRKETFFTNNRWFLLSGLITSVTLPLFFIEKVIFIEKPKLSSNDFLVMGNHTTNTAIVEQVEPIKWLELAGIGYGLLVGFFLIRVLINIISFYKLLHNKKIEKYETYSIVDLNEDIAPFSFFNFIVFNSSLYSNEELQNILMHEKVHCQQKHSLDVLLANLFTIVFWFNPFIWLYKKAIIQNLEFIADNRAIQLIEDKKAYQKALLKVVSHQNCLPITNNFYQSLIKKRIVMLNKNQSNRSNSWKYSVVIPALVAFVLLFQIKVVAQQKTSNKKVNNTEKVTFMDWKKDTPDNELNHDIKELKKLGITLKYSNLKRNEKGEIIAIKVDFQDNEGNSGTTQFNGKTPIKPIHFFKTESGIGFGYPKRHVAINSDKENETAIEYYAIANDSISDDVAMEIPEPPAPPSPIAIEKSIENKTNNSSDSKPLIIINGKKFDEETLKKLDVNLIEKVDVLKDINATKIYGKEGENGVIIVTTKVLNNNQDKKPIIFSNDNGDDIVFIPSENSLKLPGYPSIQLKIYPPILIVNGVEKSNPLETLNEMDLQKVKSIRVYDENDKETKGSPIKKVVITTK